MNVGFSDIAAILAVLVSLGTLVITWRKMPHETKELDARTGSQEAETASKRADTVTKYQEIADRAAAKALKLETRVDELEAKIDLLEAINLKLQEDNEDLREWATRLVHQVQSLGDEPVKLRERKRQT